MLSELTRLRRINTPLDLCTKQIGISYVTAIHQARALGIADRRNRGRLPGIELARDNREHER